MVQQLLTQEEQQIALMQIKRLAAHALASLPEADEAPPLNWQQPWRAACSKIGLLPEADGAESGLGLWQPGLETFSALALREVASCSAGAALLLHRDATVSLIAGKVNAVPSPGCVVSLLGGQGLGRGALALWIAARNMTPSALAEMQSNWSADTSRILVSGAWQWLLMPVWRDASLLWAVRERHMLNAAPAAHAFTECGVWHLEPAPLEYLEPLCPRLLTELLTIEFRALIAIMAGVVEHALVLASDYAGQRRQGGQAIVFWPAVREMLLAMRTTRDQLNEAIERPLDHSIAGLAVELRRLLRLAPLTCEACNQAMQVFGGNGYMRDYPVERLVREANVLRRLSGPLPQLSQLCELLEGYP